MPRVLAWGPRCRGQGLGHYITPHLSLMLQCTVGATMPCAGSGKGCLTLQAAAQLARNELNKHKAGSAASPEDMSLVRAMIEARRKLTWLRQVRC